MYIALLTIVGFAISSVLMSLRSTPILSLSTNQPRDHIIKAFCYGALLGAALLGTYHLIIATLGSAPQAWALDLVILTTLVGSVVGFCRAPLLAFSSSRSRDSIHGAFYGSLGGLVLVAIYGTFCATV